MGLGFWVLCLHEDPIRKLWAVMDGSIEKCGVYMGFIPSLGTEVYKCYVLGAMWISRETQRKKPTNND